MTSRQLSHYFSDLSGLPALDREHVLTAVIAAVGTITFLSTAWVVRDYKQWVAFGSGGTPPTPSGYWRMTKLRLLAYQSGEDMRDTSSLDKAEGPKLLTRELRQRQGERPQIVARTMPQRQKPEPLDPAIKERLHGLPKKFCTERPDILVLDLSNTEGRSTDAIYAKPDLPGRHPSARDRVLKNEIAHFHPADNSAHVWLSGPDAKEVIEKGWGERFPLSAMGMCHQSWTMLYAPRSMEDVDVIEEIVKAGVQYLTGEEV